MERGSTLEDFRAGASWLSGGDSAYRSGLLFYGRAIWAYETATGSIRGNWESYSQAVKETGWAAAIAVMLLWKVVETLTGEENDDRPTRLAKLGFDAKSIAEFDEFHDLRNRVMHDEWEKKDPNFLNNSYGRFRELTRQLLMRTGQRASR